MTACIDVTARFGHRYRVAHEEQAAAWPLADRIWLAYVACRYGHVGVQGGERLYAFTGRSRIGPQLRALPFVEKAQGGAETRVVFHVDDLEAVLAILRPRRRRRLSDAERARLSVLGAAHRFEKGAAAGVQSDFVAAESARASLPVPEPQPGPLRAPEAAEVVARPARVGGVTKGEGGASGEGVGVSSRFDSGPGGLSKVGRQTLSAEPQRMGNPVGVPEPLNHKP